MVISYTLDRGAKMAVNNVKLTLLLRWTPTALEFGETDLRCLLWITAQFSELMVCIPQANGVGDSLLVNG